MNDISELEYEKDEWRARYFIPTFLCMLIYMNDIVQEYKTIYKWIFDSIV